MTSHNPPLMKEEFKSSTHYLQRLTISVLLEELWKSVVADEACGTPKESVPVEDKTFPSETTRIVCVHKLYPAV